MITARKCGSAASSTFCSSSSPWNRLSRGISLSSVMAASVPILNGFLTENDTQMECQHYPESIDRQ
jgi:hypothetical protein